MRKEEIKYAKFNIGEKPLEKDYVPFVEMKRRIQQELLHLKIDIDDDKYKDQKEFIELNTVLMTDTESQYIYTEIWFIEKYIVGQKRLEKIYGCYAMGIKRRLEKNELDVNAMCKALTIYAPECYGHDEKDIYRNITRTGEKAGLIQRLKEQLGFDVEEFCDEQEMLKLLYLCYRFEMKYGSKVLTAFLQKPSLENADTIWAGIKTANGEMMAFLKHNIEREISPRFITTAKRMVDMVAAGWERQIRDVRIQLDVDLFKDNRREIERIYKMVGGYAQFYNKKTYLHGRYKHSLLETFYLKLLEHENLGREYDIISVSNDVLNADIIQSGKCELYDQLAVQEVKISEVDDYLRNNRLKMVSYVFEKEKTTSNEKDKYDRAATRVKYFLKMLIENTKYKGISVVSVLLLVMCIQEIISLTNKDKIENHYYKAGMEAIKSIKSELHDDNNDPIKTMSQIVWVERVMYRYNSCRHDTDILRMARQTEKYIDYLIARTFETNSLVDMRVIHTYFMLNIQGMIYPQDELEKKAKHFERILRRKAEKYKVQIPYGDSWGYARQFFSIPISEVELEKTAKKLFKAMIAAKKAKKPQFFDYELTSLSSYFDEPVRIYFELVVEPEFRQISIQRMELLPYNEWLRIKEENGIHV